LVDDIDGCFSDEARCVISVLGLYDVLAREATCGEICSLVLLALAADQVGLRVVDERPLEFLAGDRKLKRDKVLALEEVVQQRGRQLWRRRSSSHPRHFASLAGCHIASRCDRNRECVARSRLQMGARAALARGPRGAGRDRHTTF
jgi:hypothetical protein